MDLFKNGFAFEWACFEGRYRQLSDFAQANNTQSAVDEDLIPQIDRSKPDDVNLYEYLRVFKNLKINEIIQSRPNLKAEWEKNFSTIKSRFGDKWPEFKSDVESKMFEGEDGAPSNDHGLTQKGFKTYLEKELSSGDSMMHALPEFMEANDYQFAEVVR